MGKRGPKQGVKKAAGSGRKKGQPNKRTWELISVLEEKGYDPAAKLIQLGLEAEESYMALNRNSENAPQFLKVAKDAASDLMRYVYPQRKALDLTTGGEKLQTLTDIFASVVNAKRGISSK